MAAGDARTMWQRTASICMLAKDQDSAAVRAPKLAHCPVLPKLAQIDIIPPEAVRVVEHTPPSYSWTNSSSWASMDTKTIWHLSPSAAYWKDTTSKSDSLLERSLKESPVLLLNCGAEAIESPAVQVGIQQKENTDTVIQLSGTCLSDEQTVEMQGIQHHETMDTSTQLRGKSFIDGQCAEIFDSDFRKVVETPATLASSVSWRTANKEALAALVAQKSAARLENCDLPTPLSKSLLTAAPQMVEPEASQIMEQNLIASIFQAGGDLMHSERLELPTSPLSLGRSETNSGAYQVCRMISQPLTVPTIHHASPNLFHGSHSLSSTDNRTRLWNPGVEEISSSLGKESGLFGEALCHSQTRAREAEKRAEQSFQDCKKLSHLFFREASLSLTYRQWISTLQAENTCLKMYMRNQRATVQWQQSLFSPFTAIDHMLRLQDYKNEHGCSSRKLLEPLSAIWAEKDCRRNFDNNQGQDGADILMSCTLSFAFALGLSLASAGLMLGWSMGWILLAY
ncbi:unnamed protein product [Sphagnum jensenii]|uniref:Uncharacterized protein n=1 Tax=Sphagnum jensenii TaxID=128206 RepID=A0ABP0XNV1_9BRYO